MHGKTVLITGAAGFLGRYFMSLLTYSNQINSGKPIAIIALDNYITSGKPAGNNILRDDKNVEWIVGDASIGSQLPNKFDFIIHTAGIASPEHYRANPLLTIDVTINVTKALLERAKTDNSRMLFFSSSEIYPLGYEALGLPETPNKLNARLILKIGGEVFNVLIPLSYKKLDPVKGDVVEALRIVLPASISFSNRLIFTDAAGYLDAAISVHTYKEINHAQFKVHIYGAFAEIKAIQNEGIRLRANMDTVFSFHLKAKSFEYRQYRKCDFMAEIEEGTESCGSDLHIIQYNHIPTLQYFTIPNTIVIQKDWKCTAKRIGFIEGAGDYMPTFLRLAGMEVDVLKESDLADAGKLKKYDAIVTGIRAVNVEKRMVKWLPVLFKYAENGGTLIMQYNTLQDMATQKLGPYPFTIADKRVTEEDAKMSFVDPKCRLLNYPNKITDADFEHWVQERGLYFPTSWDEHYKPLFSMHDTGEEPLTGGTLYAKVGKGNYIYTSLSFSRQLPAGNKGAMRLLMNFLSVGK